jgi:hypothetical protein
MMKSSLFLIFSTIYVIFFVWYTNFNKPLTELEVENYIESLKQSSNNEESINVIKKFLSDDDGKQFIMVNLLGYSKNPPLLEKTKGAKNGKELVDYYTSFMFKEMFTRASHPVIFGSVVGPSIEVIGMQNARSWDEVGLIRYRSRRDMMEIIINPEFQNRHAYKIGGLERTIASPIQPSIFIDGRFIFFLILSFLYLSIRVYKSK